MRRRFRRFRQYIRRDDGMVTAETAVVLPVLLVFTLVAVGAITVAQARVHCADVAREAARAAARNASYSAMRTTVYVSRQGDSISATAELTVQPVSWLPAVTVTEAATAAAEPDAGDAP